MKDALEVLRRLTRAFPPVDKGKHSFFLGDDGRLGIQIRPTALSSSSANLLLDEKDLGRPLGELIDELIECYRWSATNRTASATQDPQETDDR